MRVFRYCQNSVRGTVLIFLHEVKIAQRPQFGATAIFGGDFVLRLCFGPK